MRSIPKSSACRVAVVLGRGSLHLGGKVSGCMEQWGVEVEVVGDYVHILI